MINRNWYRLRLTTLFFLMVALSLLAAHSASASVTRWARWEIDIAFPNNKIDTQLIIQVGHTTLTGDKVVDTEASFPVPCQIIGTVDIDNEQATFAGGGYFKCAVPSIREKVYQMPGHLLIPISCDSKQPFVAGSLIVEDNPAQWSPENPIFHRDDIQFGIPFNSATQQAQMTVAFSSVPAESGNFVPGQTAQNILAIYNKTGQHSYAPAFIVGSTSLSATPATFNGQMPLSTLKSTVYIGYSPISGKHFEGMLSTLLVDPVCIGQG